mmetsp:Transcript_41506/g.117548  ORF Transcript_41506/g.117548 Transcript_41506/m.117548 type:complete len:227 (-) Transcript_41506:523-1203(-)
MTKRPSSSPEYSTSSRLSAAKPLSTWWLNSDCGGSMPSKSSVGVRKITRKSRSLLSVWRSYMKLPTCAMKTTRDLSARRPPKSSLMAPGCSSAGAGGTMTAAEATPCASSRRRHSCSGSSGSSPQGKALAKAWNSAARSSAHQARSVLSTDAGTSPRAAAGAAAAKRSTSDRHSAPVLGNGPNPSPQAQESRKRRWDKAAETHAETGDSGCALLRAVMAAPAHALR